MHVYVIETLPHNFHLLQWFVSPPRPQRTSLSLIFEMSSVVSGVGMLGLDFSASNKLSSVGGTASIMSMSAATASIVSCMEVVCVGSYSSEKHESLDTLLAVIGWRGGMVGSMFVSHPQLPENSSQPFSFARLSCSRCATANAMLSKPAIVKTIVILLVLIQPSTKYDEK